MAQRESFRGSLGGAAIWRLPLAQGAILETRDRIPRRPPGAWSLLLPLPVSLALSLSLSLSLSLCVCVTIINKKKERVFSTNPNPDPRIRTNGVGKTMQPHAEE